MKTIRTLLWLWLQTIVLTNVEPGTYRLQAVAQGDACFYRVQSPWAIRNPKSEYKSK